MNNNYPGYTKKMIIGKQFVEDQERLYSTGDQELDELLERAFCEGYELAQREFGRTGLTAQQANQFFTKTGNRDMRKATEAVIGFYKDSSGKGYRGPAANTRREAKWILSNATLGGRQAIKEAGSSGHTAASDILINAREKMFKPLSKKKRQEINKSLLKATYKQPSVKNSGN